MRKPGRRLATHMVVERGRTTSRGRLFRTACNKWGMPNFEHSLEGVVPNTAGCGIVAVMPSDFWATLDRPWCQRCRNFYSANHTMDVDVTETDRGPQ